MSFVEKSFGLALLWLAALVALLLLVLWQSGGRLPELGPLPPPPTNGAAVAALRSFDYPGLLAPRPPAAVPTNAVSPFFTLQFQPPPPPPPPATKKVELLYMGCYVSSTGDKLAYLQVVDQVLVLTNGAKVVADHMIQSISLPSMTLTNAAGQTNVLEFNVKKALDVPIS
ncbi:MAG: hypothetical protein FJ387_08785 [Verrucomicrobia bacterium]|nr:hypothetical protein [Verrucomicrobiota bacterium]